MPLFTPSFSQSTRLGQKLAPNMRQSLKMLQMTSLELQAEIRQQMAVNPVIEDVRFDTETPFSHALPDEQASGQITEHELDFTPSGTAAEAILQTNDGYRDYFLSNLENAPSDEAATSARQRLFDTLIQSDTLQDHLRAQIPLSDIPPEQHALAATLIGHINDDGYFTGSIPDIQMVTGASQSDIDGTLAQIRSFDPLGCGARTLQECLLAQMEKLAASPWQNAVQRLIQNHLDDLAAHRDHALQTRLNVSKDAYATILATLRTLDPRPGRALKTPPVGAAIDIRERENVITPEVFAVRDKSGAWRAHVPARNIPRITLSSRYQDMIEDPACPAETKSYLRERIRSALALSDALENRQQTIRKISQAILDAQPDVFHRADFTALKPLTMQQIADETGVHATTVSRTVRDKYLATPFGTIELRRFFTAGLATESGESVSNTAVQKTIRTLIEKEDPVHPLSDDRLTALLNERGIDIKRRTVAKYRTALNIPTAQERRAR